jgi:hypothetical protein
MFPTAAEVVKDGGGVAGRVLQRVGENGRAAVVERSRRQLPFVIDRLGKARDGGGEPGGVECDASEGEWTEDVAEKATLPEMEGNRPCFPVAAAVRLSGVPSDGSGRSCGTDIHFGVFKSARPSRVHRLGKIVVPRRSAVQRRIILLQGDGGGLPGRAEFLA